MGDPTAWFKFCFNYRRKYRNKLRNQWSLFVDCSIEVFYSGFWVPSEISVGRCVEWYDVCKISFFTHEPSGREMWYGGKIFLQLLVAAKSSLALACQVKN